MHCFFGTIIGAKSKHVYRQMLNITRNMGCTHLARAEPPFSVFIIRRAGRVEPVPPPLAESRQDRSWVMSADHVQGHYQPAFSENDIPLLGGSGPVGRRPPVHHFSSTLTWYPPNISWASAVGCSVESM